MSAGSVEHADDVGVRTKTLIEACADIEYSRVSDRIEHDQCSASNARSRQGLTGRESKHNNDYNEY
jgi:hypothetical protein